MSVASNRVLAITFSGDVEFSQLFLAHPNSISPGVNTTQALTSGNNTIAVPDDATGVTIIPSSTNTIVLTLKGVSGDTGIIIAPDAPTSLGLDGVASFVLNVSGDVSVRFIFT